MQQLTDDELMAKISRGEKMAFQELFKRHAAHLLGYARGILGRLETAEEVSQDTWVKIVRLAPSYKSSGHFVAWAYTLTRNGALNRLRADQRLQLSRDHEGEEELSETATEGLSLENEFLVRADLDRARVAISELPDEQRAALLLIVVEGLSYEEAATALNTSLSAVKSLVFRARRKVGAA